MEFLSVECSLIFKFKIRYDKITYVASFHQTFQVQIDISCLTFQVFDGHKGKSKIVGEEVRERD